MSSPLLQAEREVSRFFQLSADPAIKDIWHLKRNLEKNRITVLCEYQKRLLKVYGQLKRTKEIIKTRTTGIQQLSETMIELKETIITIYNDLANDMKKQWHEEVILQAEIKEHLYLIN